MRVALILFGLVTFACAPVAFAQDDTPSDDPVPADPALEEDPPSDPPDQEIIVERPDEIRRIKAELARIKRTRERLGGKSADRSYTIERLSAEQLSPVLTPRTKVVGLRLHDAIQLALANNPDYAIQLHAARSAYQGIEEAHGVFDPVLTSSGTYSVGRSPTTLFGGGLDVLGSEIFNWTTTISKTFSLGTQVSVTWTERRANTDNPFIITGSKSYTPSFDFSISQPLLRNFGIEVNETAIKIAEDNALSSDATLADTYMNGVLAVEEAYWNLVLAEEQLRSQERSLSNSLKFLDDQRKKLAAGAGTRLEVTIAKAGVATTREAVIVAENSLESARDQMVRLTTASSDPTRWDDFVVPLDLPVLVTEPKLDAATTIQRAFKRRPDYLRARLAIDSARRNLVFTENQMLPNLSVTTSLREEGLARQDHGAYTGLASGRFYSWSVGISVDLPLFLRSERARVRAAKHDLEGAEASLRALEATVILNVRAAIRNVRTSKARIDAARASRILAEERLEATRVQVETGTAVPRNVLDDLAQLASAETNEVQAFINYRLSLSRLKVAQGTLLDEWLDEIDPRVRNALDRVPYGR